MLVKRVANNHTRLRFLFWLLKCEEKYLARVKDVALD